MKVTHGSGGLSHFAGIISSVSQFVKIFAERDGDTIQDDQDGAEIKSEAQFQKKFWMQCAEDSVAEVCICPLVRIVCDKRDF
jgi:hypothetical protein